MWIHVKTNWLTRLVLSICCLSCGSALAESAVVGTGTPASCTETSFNAALNLVVNDIQGGVLTFNCGPDPDVILLSSVKNLVNFVVIDGGGKMTLSGQDITRLFNINQDGPEGQTQVIIKNITLTAGNAANEPFGGAILVNANTALSLDNVTISNSLASVSGGAIATFANVALEINNSRFIGNLAANGGAIATRATINVNNSIFTNNNASGGEGGAIQSYEQNLTVLNSQFIGNGAEFGGAIFKGAARLNCIDGQFRNNTANLDGGALYLRADSNANEILRTTLSNNIATRDGGAIFAKNYLSITESSLSGNAGRAGGAIRIDGGEIALRRSTLDNNTAEIEGGGLSMVVAGSVALLSYLTTSNNTVTAGYGGDLALYSNGFRVVNLENSTLMGGLVTTGGGSVDITGDIQFNYRASMLWSRQGAACFSFAPAGFTSLGRNLTDLTCNLTETNDVFVTAFSGFGLGEFDNYGGATHTYLPLPGSIAIDRADQACESQDTRKKPAPIDGDGNGSALCDTGAVERQLNESGAVLFRNDFE